MRAVICVDKEQALSVQEAPMPQAGPGEVVVKIKAAAFNHRDWWIQKGMYAGLRYPIILGSDGCGVVHAVHDHADSFWVGKEVIINPGMHWGNDPAFHAPTFKILGLPDDGTFAEYVKVPSSALYPKPAYLSLELVTYTSAPTATAICKTINATPPPMPVIKTLLPFFT